MLLISMFLETPSPSPTWAREDGHSGLAPDRVDDSLTFHPEDPSLEVSPPDPDGEAQCGAGETVWNGMVRLCVVWAVSQCNISRPHLVLCACTGQCGSRHPVKGSSDCELRTDVEICSPSAR